MKTERELFLKINNLGRLENMIEYSEDRNIFVFKVVNCNLDLGVALHKLNYGWKMWQASAQREGYKFMPVETLRRTMGHICTAMHHPMNTRQEEDIMQSDTDIIEKSMTGAAP